MAASLVQQFGGQAFAPSLQTTVSIASGHNVVVVVGHQGVTDPVITDSAGGTWQKVGSTADATPTAATAQRLQSMWVRFGIPAALTWIKVASASVTTNIALEMIVADVANITALRTASVANVTSGSVGTPVSAAVGDFAITAVAYTASSRTEVDPTGYTGLTDQTTSTTYLAAAFNAAVATTGSTQPNWTGIAASSGVITAAFVTDASGAYTVTAAVTPNSAPGNNRGQQRTLTLSVSGGNGNAITFGPVDWGDGLTPDAAVTKAVGVTSATFTRTPTTSGTGRTLSWTVSQS